MYVFVSRHRSREPEDRLSEDLAKLRDRLRDVGVKASPEGKQGARLKSEVSSIFI